VLLTVACRVHCYYTSINLLSYLLLYLRHFFLVRLYEVVPWRWVRAPELVVPLGPTRPGNFCRREVDLAVRALYVNVAYWMTDVFTFIHVYTWILFIRFKTTVVLICMHGEAVLFDSYEMCSIRCSEITDLNFIWNVSSTLLINDHVVWRFWWALGWANLLWRTVLWPHPVGQDRVNCHGNTGN